MNSLNRIIQESIDNYFENTGFDPSILLLDDETYFQLKLSEYHNNAELAIEMELTEYMGLKVFYARLGYTYVDVAR